MRFLSVAFTLFCLSTMVVADEPPPNDAPVKEQDETVSSPLPEGAKPVTIRILTRNKVFQHFYSISEKEVDNLTSPQSVDPHGDYRYWGILGYGASKPGVGMTKLNRVLITERGTTYATFYVKAPKELNRKAKIQFFPVWVWEKKQPGLVPVYACSAENWRNMLFTTDKNQLNRALDQSYKTRKVRLKNHGIMFYVMPPPKLGGGPKAAPETDDNP